MHSIITACTIYVSDEEEFVLAKTEFLLSDMLDELTLTPEVTKIVYDTLKGIRQLRETIEIER